MNYAISKVVPELMCSDIIISKKFYIELLGFNILYETPEERFVYLDRDGAQIMLEQPTGRAWLTGPLEHPYGRGINFQIKVQDIQALYKRCKDEAHIFMDLEEKWYRRQELQLGNWQFIVQDPDGYLLRFFQDLGQKPI